MQAPSEDDLRKVGFCSLSIGLYTPGACQPDAGHTGSLPGRHMSLLQDKTGISVIRNHPASGQDEADSSIGHGAWESAMHRFLPVIVRTSGVWAAGSRWDPYPRLSQFLRTHGTWRQVIFCSFPVLPAQDFQSI